jgi:hypothetical protein
MGECGFGTPPTRPGVTWTPPPAWRSLAQVRPELLGELHRTLNGSLDPHEVAAGSHRKLCAAVADCRFAQVVAGWIAGRRFAADVALTLSSGWRD